MKRAMDFLHGWIPIGGGRRVYGETKEVVSVMWWTWKRLALCMLVLASLPFLFPVLFLSLFVGLMVSMPLLCGVAAYLVVFRGFSLPWNLTKSALPKLLPAQRTSGSQTRVFVRQAEGLESSPTVESQGHEHPNDLFLSEAGAEGIKPAQEVLESEHKAEETARELGLPKVSGVGYPIGDQPGRQLPIAVKVPITDTFSGEDSTDDVVRAGVEIDSGELPDSNVEMKTAKGSEIRPDVDDLEADGVANGEFVEDEVPAKASEDISGAEESSTEQTETDRSSESLLPPGLSQRHHIVDDQTGEDITKVQRTSEGISRVPQFESYGRVDGASLELESAPAYHSFADGVRTEDSSMQEDTSDPFVEAESSKEQGPGREGLVSGPLHVAEVPTLSQQSPLAAEQIGEDAEVELLPSFPRGAHGVPMEVAQEPSFTLGEQAEKGLRSEAPVSGAHVKDQGEGERDAALEGLVSSAPGQLGEQSERELRLGAPGSGAYVVEQGEGEADATPEVSLSVAPGQLGEQPEEGLQSSKDQGGGEMDATPETSLNVQPYEGEAQQKPTDKSFLNSMIPGKPRDEIEEKSLLEPLPSAEHPTEARHGLKGMLTQLVTGVLGESLQEADGIGLIPKASPSPADRMNVSEQPEESLSEASAVHEHATSSGGEAQDEPEKGIQSSKDQGGGEMDATPETSLNIQPYEGEAQQKPTDKSFLNSMIPGKPRDEIEEKSLLEPLPSAEHPTEARHGLKGMLTQLLTGVFGESRQEADGIGLIPKASPSPADRMNVSEQPEESLSEASAVHEHATSSGGEAQDVQPSDASLEPAGRQFIQNDHPYTSPSIESGEQGQDPSPETLQITQKISPTAANLTKAGEQPTESSPGVSTFHGFAESRREAQDEMTADASLMSFEPAERFSVQEDHPDTSLSMKSGEKGGEDSSPERQQSMAHHRVQEENVVVPSADKSVRYTTGPPEEASEMSALRTSANGPFSTETKEGRVESLRTEAPMETAPFMGQKGEDEESRQKLLLSGKEAGEALNEEATLGSSINTGRLGNLREESEESTHTASSVNAHYRLPFEEVHAESTLETTPNTDKFLDLRSPEASTAASLSISSDDARKLIPEVTMPLKKPEAEPQEKILAEPIRDGTHVLEQREEAESVPALPETTVQQKPIPSTEPANTETSLRYDLPRFDHARRLSFSRTGDELEDIESESLPVPGQPKVPRPGEERSEIEYVEPETHLEPGQFKGPRSDEERSTFTHTSSEYAWPSESSEQGYQESLAEKESSKPFELQTPAQADSESGPSSESADDWQRRRERWEAESRPGGLLQSAPNMQPHSFEARSMCNPLYEFSTPSPLPRRSSTGVSKDFSFTSSSDFSQALKRHSAPEYRHSRPSLSDSALSPPHHRFREFKKGRYREWSEHDELGKSFTPGFPPRSYSASWSESLEPYEGEFEGLLQYWQERDKATPSPSPTSLTKYTSATSPAVLAAQLREEINTIQRIVGQDIEPQHSLWKDVESLSELVGMELPYMGDVSDLMKARQGLDLLKVVVGIRWDVEQDEYSK